MTCAVSISIINFRTAELTLACIRSVLADMAGSDRHPSVAAEIIVVDNDSGDGSAETIAAWIEVHPDAPVRLIRSPTNTGFPGGHNQGIAASSADFILVLNSDAELRPGCLATLLAAAETTPRAGMLAPRLEDEDGTAQISCFRFPSPGSEMIRGAATGPVTRLLRRYDMPLGENPDPADIGWVSFACVLIRRQTLEEVGLLDEGYFLYFDDTDYCFRARKAGWQSLYVPQARTVHHRGGSGPVKALAAARKRLPPYFYASRTRFFHLSRGRWGLLAANLSWIAGRTVANLRVLFGKPRARAAEHEARDIWTNFLHPLGPRRAPGE